MFRVQFDQLLELGRGFGILGENERGVYDSEVGDDQFARRDLLLGYKTGLPISRVRRVGYGLDLNMPRVGRWFGSELASRGVQEWEQLRREFGCELWPRQIYDLVGPICRRIAIMRNPHLA